MPNITNTDELIDTLTNLTTSVELPGGRFEPKMNAGANNTTFDNIEQAFNQLYQKLRQLEDLHNFTELYIRNEFKKNKEALDDAIQKLDAAGDDYTNTSTKANTASFQNSLVVTDRDGSSISTGTIIDGSTIMAASTDLTEAEPVQVNIQSSDIASGHDVVISHIVEFVFRPNNIERSMYRNRSGRIRSRSRSTSCSINR